MRSKPSVILLSLLTGCGTTYNLPELTPDRLAQADAIIQDEASRVGENSSLEAEILAKNFFDMLAQTKPVAEEFCAEQKSDQPDFNCDVRVVVDEDLKVQPNAFHYFDDAGDPVIMFNIPFIAKARNQDELAFVYGHEMGHLIGEHIEKREQQEVAGAIIAGVLMGLSQAAASYANPYRSTATDQIEMQNAMTAGSGIGAVAYSQTYELEADLIGAYIAERAGYDPELGSRIFVHREDAQNIDGTLSFWGTHPESPERIATVVGAMERITEQRQTGIIPTPD